MPSVSLRLNQGVFANITCSVVCFLLGNSPASEIQMPGTYPEENIRHTDHGKSLKSRITCSVLHVGSGLHGPETPRP
jgi:hypothetical protein